MIIDYDDMLAVGMVKCASNFMHDNTNAAYAIFLNTPAGAVGKFRVTTVPDIYNAVEAINKNASLPSYIKNPARYYVQKAANDMNVYTGWEPQPDGKYSRFIDYIPLKEKAEPIYVMKMAGQRDIEIYDSTDYDTAVDMFKTSGHVFSGKGRIAIAADLLKTAIALNIACDPYVHAYAHANYSSRTADLLDARKSVTNNVECRAKYDIVKEAYAELGDNLSPDMFITAVEGIDKEAGVKRDVVQFFQ